MDVSALAAQLGELLGPGHRVEELSRLSGGASRTTWAATASGPVVSGPIIIQLARPGATQAGVGMTAEAELIAAAHASGVPVPELLAADVTGQVLGAAGIITRRLEGETIPRKLLRDSEFADARERLAADCGRALAAIHAVPVARVPSLTTGDQLDQFREILDLFGNKIPTFELAFRWLGANRPPSDLTTVVHGDFRNGNLLVDRDGLRAVLDWELAHLGDPIEDLGWLCARAWRFGAAPRVGGFGTVDDLCAAYESGAGREVDRDALVWWETLATLKWGIMCIIQASGHLSGASRSVELAAIGRRVCENEHDLLELLP